MNALNLSLKINISIGWQSTNKNKNFYVFLCFQNSKLAYITPQQRLQVKRRKPDIQSSSVKVTSEFFYYCAPWKKWDTKTWKPESKKFRLSSAKQNEFSRLTLLNGLLFSGWIRICSRNEILLICSKYFKTDLFLLPLAPSTFLRLLLFLSET